MKILILHLSDLHFENTEQTHSINVDKMISAMNSTLSAEECIIIISGDLANTGTRNNYNYVKGFLAALMKALNENGFENKTIPVLTVPGNHDIDFSGLSVSIDTITDAYNEGRIDQLEQKYLDNMRSYFSFAYNQDCFKDDKMVSRKIIEYGNKKIGFVLCNTAPMSLLGGNAVDMGSHYLSESGIVRLEEAVEADICVLVMHHSIEWLESCSKNKLRNVISKRYSMVLSGHEHMPVGESDIINAESAVQFVQGNALQGKTDEGNGFCALSVDLEDAKVEGYSYVWEGSVYIPQKIIDTFLRVQLFGDFILKEEFQQQIIYDSSRRLISDYYVFPGVSYNRLDEDGNLQRIDIDTEQELFEFLDGRQNTIIMGAHKGGKSVLAKRLFKYFYDHGKIPVMIEASEFNNKRIGKTLNYVFYDQYHTEDFAYEKYKQFDISKKVAIIDEADLLSPYYRNTLIELMEQSVGQVVVFCEDKIELNMRNSVKEALVDEDILTLRIKPFLYSKRKVLIGNILRSMGKTCDLEKEVSKINDLINMQVKYFNLDPEFIISFVNQYEKDSNFRFTPGMNVFNIVYESSIRNQIIANSQGIDPGYVISILRELAYKMHFEKRNTVKIEDISHVVEVYNKDYRQHVNTRNFLTATINAKILIENDNEVRFKDHTIVAYFVAQAINQKYYQGENIGEDMASLLKNLCFSINSDIVLFLALITNNPQFLNIIIEQCHLDNNCLVQQYHVLPKGIGKTAFS